MYFKVSWDQQFADLMMHLWAKYGREIFTENGIGDQLDLNKFSKDFFNSNTTTADVSIDDNSNISGDIHLYYMASCCIMAFYRYITNYIGIFWI